MDAPLEGVPSRPNEQVVRMTWGLNPAMGQRYRRESWLHSSCQLEPIPQFIGIQISFG